MRTSFHSPLGIVMPHVLVSGHTKSNMADNMASNYSVGGISQALHGKKKRKHKRDTENTELSSLFSIGSSCEPVFVPVVPLVSLLGHHLYSDPPLWMRFSISLPGGTENQVFETHRKEFLLFFP